MPSLCKFILLTVISLLFIACTSLPQGVEKSDRGIKIAYNGAIIPWELNKHSVETKVEVFPESSLQEYDMKSGVTAKYKHPGYEITAWAPTILATIFEYPDKKAREEKSIKSLFERFFKQRGTEKYSVSSYTADISTKKVTVWRGSGTTLATPNASLVLISGKRMIYDTYYFVTLNNGMEIALSGVCVDEQTKYLEPEMKIMFEELLKANWHFL